MPSVLQQSPRSDLKETKSILRNRSSYLKEIKSTSQELDDRCSSTTPSVLSQGASDSSSTTSINSPVSHGSDQADSSVQTSSRNQDMKADTQSQKQDIKRDPVDCRIKTSESTTSKKYMTQSRRASIGNDLMDASVRTSKSIRTVRAETHSRRASIGNDLGTSGSVQTSKSPRTVKSVVSRRASIDCSNLANRSVQRSKSSQSAKKEVTRSPCIRKEGLSKDAQWAEYRAHIQRRPKKEPMQEEVKTDRKLFSLEEYEKYVQQDVRPSSPRRRSSTNSIQSGMQIEPNQLCVHTTEGGLSKLFIPITIGIDPIQQKPVQHPTPSPRWTPSKQMTFTNSTTTKAAAPSYIQIPFPC